jgi:DNA-binding MarR family transcriptional regulator
MEAAGWLTRLRAVDDERRVIVSLTAAGAALRRQARHVPEQVACAAACELDELAALTRRLQTLRGNVSRSLESMNTPSSTHA